MLSKSPLLAGLLGLFVSGAASAACDVTLMHALTNNQVLLQAKCTGGPITGINWLKDGVSIEASMLSPSVPDNSPVYRTVPAESGTHQYTATGATGGNPATTADVAAGLAVTLVTAQPVLTVAPSAGGSISSSPAGITACTSANLPGCTAAFDTGASVVLTAAVDSGFAFSGWSGDCTGTATVCALNMSGPKTVSANFGPQPANGVCGSASSTTPVASAPSANLCNPGTPSAVADPGTAAAGSYTWTCAGLNGGSSSGQCSVPKIVAGACGTANGTTGLAAAPTGTAACNPGTSQNMTAATQSPWNFTWTCAGYNGGATSGGCSAEMAQTAGTCGTANGTNVAATPTGTAACGAGTVSGMTPPATAGGDYSWTCAGLAGGATSPTCTAHQTVNGACGTANGVAVSSAPSSGLCVTGTNATAVSGTGPWTWGCNGVNGGTSTSATACSAPLAAAGSCGQTPAAFTIVEPNTTVYSGTWRPDSSSSTYVAQLPVGAGVALKFTANTSVYPNGFKITDSTGGSKTYVVSRCPGSTTPVDNQNGTISVNGDSRLDNCKVNNGYARWVNTSGATAVYYSGSSLSYQTTCFLPTTTALGSGTPETYYINILNTGTTAVGVQYSNNPQLN